jgi:hypothetical protein
MLYRFKLESQIVKLVIWMAMGAAASSVAARAAWAQDSNYNNTTVLDQVKIERDAERRLTEKGEPDARDIRRAAGTGSTKETADPFNFEDPRQRRAVQPAYNSQR